MKKIFLMAVAALLLAAPATQAQKVDEVGLNASIAKCDAEVEDAKKGLKAATWIKRAQAYYAAIEAPTKGLFVTQPTTLLTTFGKPEVQTTAQIRIGQVEAWEYPWVTIYISNGQVVAWNQKSVVAEGLYEGAIESLKKALEIDPKTASKVKNELDKIANFYKQEGNVNYDGGNYRKAADAYVKGYEAMEIPAYGAPADASLLYNAGYLLVVDANENPASFAEAEQVLRKAVVANYDDGEGNLYYYLFHSCYGQAIKSEGDQKAALLQAAKAALTEGIEKYPTNENIIGAFLGLYMSEPSVGNPAELIDMIKAAIERDPQSVEMWSSLALANYQMKDFDAAIEAGAQAAALAPDTFDSNYRQGIFWAAKGDAMNEEINKKTYTRQSEYDADLAKVNDAYRGAVPWLEKAHQIMPENRGVVETLKTIFFRLRDEAGMMDKYTEYNELLKTM